MKANKLILTWVVLISTVLYSWSSCKKENPLVNDIPEEEEFKSGAIIFTRYENLLLNGDLKNNMARWGKQPGNPGEQIISTETKSGGIVGVFKQFSPVNEQWVTINYLAPERNYRVIHAPSGSVVLEGTGEELQNKGFKVIFEAEFQGELYEITSLERLKTN